MKIALIAHDKKKNDMINLATKYKDVLIPPEKVKIKVTVNDEQVTEQEVSEDEKALQVNFDGEGTVRIKVIIDGSTKKTVDMNLNSETTNIP